MIGCPFREEAFIGNGVNNGKSNNTYIFQSYLTSECCIGRALNSITKIRMQIPSTFFFGVQSLCWQKGVLYLCIGRKGVLYLCIGRVSTFLYLFYVKCFYSD